VGARRIEFVGAMKQKYNLADSLFTMKKLNDQITFVTELENII